MLQSYIDYSQKHDDATKRRYYIIRHLYVELIKLTLLQISDHFGVSERTVMRDQKEAIKEFSIFLFEIVSLEEMVNYIVTFGSVQRQYYHVILIA